jgi:hypothetical protein
VAYFLVPDYIGGERQVFGLDKTANGAVPA